MTAFWNDCHLLTNGTDCHLFKSKGIERETETSKGISTGQTYQIKRVHISKTTFDSISLYQALWFHAKVLNFFFWTVLRLYYNSSKCIKTTSIYLLLHQEIKYKFINDSISLNSLTSTSTPSQMYTEKNQQNKFRSLRSRYPFQNDLRNRQHR